MNNRIFGWSYPPGVTSLPGDNEAPYICPFCGGIDDNCDCEECKECGAVGCFDHTPTYELLELEGKLEGRLSVLKEELRCLSKKMKLYFICPVCGVTKDAILSDRLLEGPEYCPNNCIYEEESGFGKEPVEMKLMNKPRDFYRPPKRK